MKGQVSQDLLATLAGNSVYKTQLYELLGRDSNCNYKLQLITGLGDGQPLNAKIRSDIRNNANDNTALPAASRLPFNAAGALPNASTTSYPASALVVLGGPAGSAVTAHSTMPRRFTTAANVLTFTAAKAVVFRARATVGLGNGTAPIGSGHPVPVFVSPTESAHDVTVHLELEVAPDGTTWEVVASSPPAVLHHADIVAFATKTLTLNVRQTVAVGTKARLKVVRSAKVCTFGGADDKIVMAKQGANGAAKDSSNYLDVVEIT